VFLKGFLKIKDLRVLTKIRSGVILISIMGIRAIQTAFQGLARALRDDPSAIESRTNRESRIKVIATPTEGGETRIASKRVFTDPEMQNTVREFAESLGLNTLEVLVNSLNRILIRMAQEVQKQQQGRPTSQTGSMALREKKLSLVGRILRHHEDVDATTVRSGTEQFPATTLKHNGRYYTFIIKQKEVAGSSGSFNSSMDTIDLDKPFKLVIYGSKLNIMSNPEAVDHTELELSNADSLPSLKTLIETALRKPGKS
jgi:hypothetical protein